MTFSYQPMPREEAEKQRFNLLDDGVYKSVVVKATPKISQAGNQMVELQLSVYGKNGQEHIIFDFLVLSQNMMWKTIHFCDASGLSTEYDDGKFSPELCLKKHVNVKIGKQSGKVIPIDKLNGKPIGAKYPDKNSVEDYVNPEDLERFNDFKDDGIPSTF